MSVDTCNIIKNKRIFVLIEIKKMKKCDTLEKYTNKYEK